MADDERRIRVRRSRAARRAHFDEASGEAEADAVRDAFLKGRGPQPEQQAAGLALADPATRVRVINGLQQRGGNAYVQRVVESSKLVQRAEETEGEEPPVGNPLVGLRREDGITYGTWERRPRVKLLQEKLNEKMLAGLKVDGMFGAKTDEVLREFQASIGVAPSEAVDPVTADALMGRKQEKPPDDKKPPVDMALEDLLDAVWLQYQVTLRRENDALSRLEKDLESLEKPDSSFASDLMGTLISEALKALFPEATGKLVDLIKEGLTEANMTAEDQDTTVKVGVQPAFDAVGKKAGEYADKKVKEMEQDKVPPLTAFIDAQRQAVTEASTDAQEAFLLVTRPSFRAMSDGKEKAAKLLAAAKRETAQAFGFQYDITLQKWAAYSARKQVGSVKSAVWGEDVYGADMSKAEEDMPGIVELEIECTSPEKNVTVKSAKIAGLSERVRARLQEEKRICDLGMPLLAYGDAGDGEIKIAENETGDHFNVESDEDGNKWLRQKAAYKHGLYPEVDTTADELHAIQAIFADEIGPIYLKQVKDGLQGP